MYCVCWTGIFWSGIYFSLLYGRNDSDVRYYLPGWLFLLPWGAVGLYWVLERFAQSKRSWVKYAGISTVTVALISIALLKLGGPIRYKQSLLPEAGMRIQALSAEYGSPSLMVTREKFAYYAGTRAYDTIRGSYERVIEVARADSVPYLMGFRKDFVRADPKWFDKVSSDSLTAIEPVNPDPERISDILIYRVNGVTRDSTTD
jgi:hypothetical protein